MDMFPWMAFKMQYMVKIFFCIAEKPYIIGPNFPISQDKAFIIFIHISTSSFYTDEVSNKLWGLKACFFGRTFLFIFLIF